MSAMKSTPGYLFIHFSYPSLFREINFLFFCSRKSLSRRSLQATNVSSDPSIWLPAIISEAEKLATYCKVLASKVGASWSKETEETDGGLCLENKDKVINYCRKLRKAVVTTRLNMKLLEEKMVCRFEQNYGNSADIEVDQHESSILKQDSSSKVGKRLIVKIKNFREANSKQDYYAEVRESPSPFSGNPNLSTYSRKSIGSLSSQATIPHCPSPLPTQEQSNDSDASTEAEAQPQPNAAEETRLPVVDDPIENDEFFDAFSELVESKQTVGRQSSVERDHKLSLEPFQGKFLTTETNSISPDMFAANEIDDDSDLENSANTVPLDHIQPKVEVSNVDREDVDAKQDAKIVTTPSPSAGSHRESPNTDTPSLTGTGKKPFKSKLSRSKPSSKERASPNFVPASNDEVVNSTLRTSTPVTSQSSKSSKSAALSELDLNEKARRELLRDSSESDDSLAELKLSPRVKMTKKRCNIPQGLEDDPKLKAECAVVVNRITNLVRKKNHV